MDFRRIELIFLIVFVALDIFLFASFTQNDSSTPYTTTTNLSDSEAIAQDMKEDHITVGKLSDANDEGFYLASETTDTLVKGLPQLTGQTTSYNYRTHKLTSQFNTPLTYSKEHLISELKKFIKSGTNILHGAEYSYIAGMSDPKNTLVFAQKIKQGVVLDPQGTLTFNVNNDVVTGYTQTYLPNVTVLREKQATISAQDAIQLLYTSSELVANSKIVWYRLGYSELTEVRGSVIYVPVWNVMIQHKGTKNESLKKVNALTRTVIKGSTTANDGSSSSSGSSSTAASSSGTNEDESGS
ncbi:two-component system regulatory protein YycI [Lapidilactobacillus luobeiensis]|uniref:two-component system regulatory protein YycI n=1 Tax=Lapidilactobacillus luobeiensis TaxID=2950371 RepID=UPI0021C3EAD3|nr:two-component system regulatory protein YycI [Lapidilactobacillus luobeiensis]